MRIQIIFAFKFIKRLVIDLPSDLICWSRFYLWRNRSAESRAEGFDQTGFSLIADCLPTEDVKLLCEIMGDLDLEGAMLHGGQLTGRLFSKGELTPKLRPLIDRFLPIAEGYLNTKRVKVELTYFQLSRYQDAVDKIPGGSFHLDDNKPNIKFFVYLNDVGQLNGPFNVIPGSHGLNLKKIRRFIKWSLFKKRSDLYADKDLGSEAAGAMPILGDKGFCFAVDTTAWHMAEPVISGERRVFVASFNMI